MRLRSWLLAGGGDDVARALELLEAWGAGRDVLVTLCCWGGDARELWEHNYDGFVESRYMMGDDCVGLSGMSLNALGIYWGYRSRV